MEFCVVKAIIFVQRLLVSPDSIFISCAYDNLQYQNEENVENDELNLKLLFYFDVFNKSNARATVSKPMQEIPLRFAVVKGLLSLVLCLVFCRLTKPISFASSNNVFVLECRDLVP